MKNHKWLIITIVVLAILGFTFYWFVYRPDQIEKECLKAANGDFMKCLKEINKQ